jgi:hypothetical protein
MSRIGMGIFVIISAVDALHSEDKVETTIGDQIPQIALATGILQILGALLEFYMVKVVFDGYKYLREVIMEQEKCVEA